MCQRYLYTYSFKILFDIKPPTDTTINYVNIITPHHSLSVSTWCHSMLSMWVNPQFGTILWFSWLCSLFHNHANILCVWINVLNISLACLLVCLFVKISLRRLVWCLTYFRRCTSYSSPFIMNEIVDNYTMRGTGIHPLQTCLLSSPIIAFEQELATTYQEQNLTNRNDWMNGINVCYLMVFNVNPNSIRTMKLEVENQIYL